MTRLTPFALALISLPLAAFAAVSSTSPASAEVAISQDDATPLQSAMETLKQGQRSVKKLIGEPAKNQAALLEQLGSMEAACVVAFGATLVIPEDVPKERHPLLRVGYKRSMANLLGQVLAMQEATLKGDAAALKAAYDELGEIKKSGHDHFRDF